MDITLTVNGVACQASPEPGASLLEVLREDLGITGPKYGCGEGACGAGLADRDRRPARRGGQPR